MSCRALREVLRIAVPLLLCLAVSSPAITDLADSSNRQGLHSFGVGGVALGMGMDQVLEVYPEAEIERGAANCYSYGRAIRVPELTRHIVRYKDETGELTMNFEPPYVGGKLSRIRYDRSLDRSRFDIRTLLDRLSVRYGPHDRILPPRKMEPAGRIVGFEWHGTDGAALRVVLRNHHRSNSDSLRLSFLARSAAQRSLPMPRSLSQLCGRPRRR